VQLCEQLFGSRISTGTIDAILARVADALQDPCEDLLARIRSARALHIDETGWRTAGQRRALWGAFSGRHPVLRIASDRHEHRARDLLGDTTAVVTSDRWWAYTHLPLQRRQICWAHLQRDFAAHADGLAAEKAFGEAGLELCNELFWTWEIYQHTGDRRELQRPVRARALRSQRRSRCRPPRPPRATRRRPTPRARAARTPGSSSLAQRRGAACARRRSRPAVSGVPSSRRGTSAKQKTRQPTMPTPTIAIGAGRQPSEARAIAGGTQRPSSASGAGA
jgi:hypothetical protein